MAKTSRELIDDIVSDIQSLDLTHYTAIYRLGNYANRLIAAIEVVGNEIFNEENN